MFKQVNAGRVVSRGIGIGIFIGAVCLMSLVAFGISPAGALMIVVLVIAWSIERSLGNEPLVGDIGRLDDHLTGIDKLKPGKPDLAKEAVADQARS